MAPVWFFRFVFTILIVVACSTNNVFGAPRAQEILRDSQKRLNAVGDAARRAFRNGFGTENNNNNNNTQAGEEVRRKSTLELVARGESATLQCQIEGIANSYARERKRVESQPGRDDGPEASIRRLVRWWRAHDNTGVEYPVDASKDFNYDITFSRSGVSGARNTARQYEQQQDRNYDRWGQSNQQQQQSASQIPPDQSTLKIFQVYEDYTGLYWCNYTADSEQVVIRTFTVALTSNNPAGTHNENHDVHDHAELGQSRSHQAAAGINAVGTSNENTNTDAELFCYECIPSGANEYCTKVKPSEARRACPSGRCLSMSARCEGIAEPLNVSLCDPIAYDSWTEYVLDEPVKLEAGKCAVINDEMQASIVSDVVMSAPLNHLQTALRSKEAATYDYDKCRLEQVQLCRCDTDGCNLDAKYLAAETNDNAPLADTGVEDAEPGSSNRGGKKARTGQVRQPNSSTTIASTTLITCVLAAFVALALK